MSLLLDIRQLRITFGTQTVVHGLDLQLSAGERLALVGESGSGKTLTAMALLGLVDGAQVQGQAWFAPRAQANNADTGLENDASMQPLDLLAATPAQRQALRGRDMAMVFQEPMSALNPLFSVGEQIAEVLRVKMGQDRRTAWQGAVDLLAEVGIAQPARRAHALAHQLSGGQRQRAMIAMALACRPQLLLADEPTTALDLTVRQQILDLLARLQNRYGMAVLLITHDLHLVRRFAQRVAVMQQGRIVEQGAVSALFAQPQHPYTRELLGSRQVRPPEPLPSQGPVALCAQGLCVHYPLARSPASQEDAPAAAVVPSVAHQPRPALVASLRGWFDGGFGGWLQSWRKREFAAVQDAGFALPAGQTLGVVGESGSGKSTLALALLGLLRFGGEVQVFGQRWGQSAAADLRLRKDIQVVFQDPFSSLSPRLTVEEIVGEGLQVHAPAMSKAQRRAEVLRVLEQVGLGAQAFADVLQRYPHQFSGGQRQRIAIARALIVRPRILVLDEPTSALDYTLAQQVLELLRRLQADTGLAYVLISHDMEVIQSMAHQVLVMKDGQVLESGSAGRVLQQPQHPYTQSLLAAAA